MSLPEDLRLLKHEHRIPLGFKVAVWGLLAMGVVGRVDMEVEQATALEAVTEPHREPLALLHPLSCPGIWTKSCADFRPCETTCKVDK